MLSPISTSVSRRGTISDPRNLWTCRYTTTDAMAAPETKKEILALEVSAARQAKDAPHLAARIQLERALMMRLPEILKGGVTAVEVAYPGGSTAMVEAAAVDPLLATPLAEQLGCVLGCYAKSLAQVGCLGVLVNCIRHLFQMLTPLGSRDWPATWFCLYLDCTDLNSGGML